MLLLVKQVDLFAPEALGLCDILMGGPTIGGRILAIAPDIDAGALPLPCEIIEGRNLTATPGFVDNHVHIAGGGGEGGWATRTPELSLVDATMAGVTTVVGVLGTDGVARGLEGLVAKTLALREEGLSAWCYSGSYRVPLISITGDSMKDIMMVEPIVGLGEIAISDHRSAKPTADELARIASDARVGGMLSGKAGIVNVHLGDAPEGFAPLWAIVKSGDLPACQFLPTHCNRNSRLFGEALEWLRAGGNLDLTTSSAPAFVKDGELSAASAFAKIRAMGLELGRVSFSSDGQGSLPVFDQSGRLTGVTVGSLLSLLEALRECRRLGMPLAEALLPLTANPARILKLEGKGRIQVGKDADLLLFEGDSLSLRTVIGGGRVLVRDGRAQVHGTFDTVREKKLG